MRTSVDLSDHDDSISKQSLATNQSKFDVKFLEVTDQLDKIFILTMFTFHIDNIIDPTAILTKQHNIKVLVGCAAFRPPEFYLKIEGQDLIKESGAKVVSIKRCMNGLTESFKD